MTINVVSKCVKKFIKCSESYNAESMGNGVQRATKDNGFCEGVRQACLPSRHLEGVNKGHLGIECHRRLSNTFDMEPSTTSKVCSKKSMQVFCERKWIPFYRREPSLLSQRTQGFPLNNIPGAQKEWSNETCDQLEVSQSVGGGPTFQNGGQFPVPHNPFQLSTQHNSNCFLHLEFGLPIAVVVLQLTDYYNVWLRIICN